MLNFRRTQARISTIFRGNIVKEEGVLGCVVWLVSGFVEVREGGRVWVFAFVFFFKKKSIKRKGKEERN